MKNLVEPRGIEPLSFALRMRKTACLNATCEFRHALVLLVRHIAQESQRDVDIGSIDHSRAGFAKFPASVAGDFCKPRALVRVWPQGEEQPSYGFAHRWRFTI